MPASRAKLWAPLLAAAAVAGVASAVMFVLAGQAYGRITGASATNRLSLSDTDAAVSTGQAMQLGGWVAAAAAGALAIAGVVVLVWPAGEPARVAVWPVNGGGVFALGAAW